MDSMKLRLIPERHALIAVEASGSMFTESYIDGQAAGYGAAY